MQTLCLELHTLIVDLWSLGHIQIYKVSWKHLVFLIYKWKKMFIPCNSFIQIDFWNAHIVARALCKYLEVCFFDRSGCCCRRTSCLNKISRSVFPIFLSGFSLPLGGPFGAGTAYPCLLPLGDLVMGGRVAAIMAFTFTEKNQNRAHNMQQKVLKPGKVYHFIGLHTITKQ